MSAIAKHLICVKYLYLNFLKMSLRILLKELRYIERKKDIYLVKHLRFSQILK